MNCSDLYTSPRALPFILAYAQTCAEWGVGEVEKGVEGVEVLKPHSQSALF